jgi:hypothetical protein
LSTCVAVLTVNQETNAAARRAKAIVEGLIKRLKVENLPNIAANPQAHIVGTEQHIERPMLETVAAQGGATDNHRPEGFSPGLDIDAVIQSFVPGNESMQPVPTAGLTNQQFLGPSFQDQTTYENRDGSQFGQSVLPDSHMQANSIWYDQYVPQSFPYDDLLFGFNGSMLDDYSIATYP